LILRVRDQKEFLAGTIFTVIGVVWAQRATTLPLGSATAMGPGYFPLVVAIVLACTGLLSIARSLRASHSQALEPWNVVAMLSILAGIIVFALFIDRVGIIAATVVLIVFSNPLRLLQKPLEVALLAAFTAAFVVVLFVYVLGLALPLY
jgi:hypothetical protein